MFSFRNKNEKKYWIYSAIVMTAISATLFINQPIIHFLSDQNIQAVFFLAGMALTALAVLLYGLRGPEARFEAIVIVGILAVYLMLFLRLGLSERSHIIEYSVLSIFIFKALSERYTNHKIKTALVAFLLTACIGLIDELLQFLVPHRYFDPTDILFNCLAAFFAIGFVLFFQWIRQKYFEFRSNKN